MPKQNAETTPARVGTDAFVRPAGRSPSARLRLPGRPGLIVAMFIIYAAPFLTASDCVPFQEAGDHVDETKCITGKVLRVKVGESGVHFLDFCEDQAACPFVVVVFSHDLKDVGDVRRLAGRTIEIVGNVKLYEGRPEIILSRISQIRGGAAMIPPLPKSYDVENRGHFSAGRLYPSKKPRKAPRSKPNPTAIYGYDVEGEEP
ncbi:MAG TPA: hypothetical protein VKB49_25330 [Candidatus Sulfotelmatobacter sp.]|nr:hypothetical protein [Candidatus Sulfotelmatobacter sp.]